MKYNFFSFVLLVAASSLFPLRLDAAGVPGAIFTTNANGTVVNANLYDSKCAVYLDGGPGPHAPARAAGLPDGDYYFQVTDPSGAVLLSTDPVSNRRFHVTGGVITAFTGTGGPVHPTGIDQDHSAQGAITIRLANLDCPSDFRNTSNAGDVYKVWVTPVGSFNGSPANVDNPCSGSCNHGFIASQSKTDNFKALATPSATFCLTIQKKFVDDLNSIPYPDLHGWGMTVKDASGVENYHITDAVNGEVQLCQLPIGDYTVTEDTIGPLPPSYQGLVCLAPLYLITLNGELQPPPNPIPSPWTTIKFTWTTTSPATLVFVNKISCIG